MDPKNKTKTQQALTHARTALQLDPTQIANYRILAQGLELDHQKEKIQQLLSQARETPSDEAGFHLRMAELWSRILRESGSQPSSIGTQILPFYEKAYQADKSSPETAFLLGQAHFELGNYTQALEFYEITLKRNRKLPGLRERLALCYMSSGRESDAIHTLETLVHDFPDRNMLYATIAELYERAGKWQEAEHYYARYLQPQSANAHDYLRLAQARLMLNRPQDALDTLQQAEQEFPAFPQILLYKSHALRSLKRYPEALTQLVRMEHLAQGDSHTLDASFYFQYGATLNEAGQTVAAEKCCAAPFNSIPNIIKPSILSLISGPTKTATLPKQKNF
ncbi:MAG: tetratricopeptide repeat protein [Blastochloris sp.]|nr:tetratricopeptide repeat protein [Blastochloris sp.]